MAKYKTAMGKIVDMSALAAKNEHVRAVGNTPMNARGDMIDSTGKVITPVTKRVGNRYQKTVSNRAANIVRDKKETKSTNIVENAETDLTSEELDFLDTTQEDIEITKIKADKKKNGK